MVSALAIHQDKLHCMCDICERNDCTQSHLLASGPFLIYSGNHIHTDGRLIAWVFDNIIVLDIKERLVRKIVRKYDMMRHNRLEDCLHLSNKICCINLSQ